LLFLSLSLSGFCSCCCKIPVFIFVHH
jgi:hypothetical protein